EASGTAISGSYSNTGRARGSSSGDGRHSRTGAASDASNSSGDNPQIAVNKVTVDGSTSGDGLNILSGESIKWRYTVTNTGNVALSGVTVTDSVSGVTPSFDHEQSGHGDAVFDPSEVWVFTASGTSVSGASSTTGTATGSVTDSAGHTRSTTASDSSSYLGDIPHFPTRRSSDLGSTSGDGLNILSGEPIKWRYTVTNTGNVALSGVTVTD